ncbi:MAG: type II toxin-antitoxin system RelE/ParE family toxin [Spirochaetales bacterium]|nr:type II toxin-antitoxin system RelE/ParE family toxin [Spirochaetales bacterium]
MKKLKTKWFNNWAVKNKIDNSTLNEGISNLENQLSAINLGSNLFKVRIARKGSGKSSGYRTIIVYKANEKAIFIYGFSKNEQENINKTELSMFKKLGKDLLNLTDSEIDKAINKKILHNLEV